MRPSMTRGSFRAPSEPGLCTTPAFPRAVRGFAGRDEEIQRVSRLIDQEVLFLVYGLGGIGKTQTAIEYAHRHHEEYKAVLWVTADTELARAGLSCQAALEASSQGHPPFGAGSATGTTVGVVLSESTLMDCAGADSSRS